MRTLIIPDIHNRTALAEKTIANERADLVIFLGDYFDSFYDHHLMAEETARWLRDSLQKENRVHLLGNHDLHYMVGTEVVRCSGFSHEKYREVNKIMQPDDWARIKYYYAQENVLFTHAGLHRKYFKEEFYIRSVCNFLFGSCQLGMIDCTNNEHNWVFNAGVARGGYFDVGGIVWCDFVREFKLQNNDIVQICGHTPGEIARRIKRGKGRQMKYVVNNERFALADGGAFCLDSVRGNWYGIIENGFLTVRMAR